MDSYKRLALNAVLAGIAAFAGGIALTGTDQIGWAALAGVGWAAVRVVAGVIAAGLGAPVPVDK